MAPLTEKDIDHLAQQASEMIGFQSGSTVAYDVAGYRRCSRNPVDPASLPAWDLAALGVTPQPVPETPPQAQFEAGPYPARLAGFRRRELFGPDEIGARLRSLGIAFNDGLGNGLYESLLINRKYGLNHVLEAPLLGFPLAYLEDDMEAFAQRYGAVVDRWVADLREMESVYHGPLAQPGQKLVVLWARHYPLDLFTRAYLADGEGISREMEATLGFAAPPLDPQTPAERLAVARFWTYVQGKLTRLLKIMTGAVRQALGPGTQIAANPHELPVLDLEGQGEAYEYPAVAIRPLLLNDPVFLRGYIAYFTQLFNDLTGKPPMVSVRMNLSAASPLFVPTQDLIDTWYDQAVRHGAGAFYFWTRDYPPCEGAYDGPIPGNPIPATLPQERWEATLQALSRVSNGRRFRKPAAQVAILVPTNSALLHNPEWRRIYAAFAALTEARVHTRFVSDRQIEGGGVPGEVGLLLAPVLEFISPALRQGLETFTARGGALLTAGQNLHDDQGCPSAPIAGAGELDPSLFEVFNTGQPGSLDDLQRSAEALAAEVTRRRLDTQAWVFQVTSHNLPPTAPSYLREPDPGVLFAPWQYEHGSEWIMPYIRPIQP